MKSDYDDETLDDYEARPPGRSTAARPASRPHRERWRRIAEGSALCVISDGGYSYSQHSHERENARRLIHTTKQRKRL